MKKILIIVLVMMIVATSGCSGSGSDFNSNAGAVVQNLGFDVNEVYDDDTSATLMFDVVNVGAKDISGNVDIYVYGPTFGSSSEVWGDLSGKAGGNSYIHDTVSGLNPADPTMGIPGGRSTMTYDLRPADVIDGVKIPTEFYVRLCFEYTTETLTQVEVTSKNELRATGVQSSRSDTINAAGPIHINAQGNGNIRSGGLIPLVLEVRDVGGGFATEQSQNCEVDKTTTERDKVNIAVTVDGNPANCGGTSGNAVVRIRDGSGKVFCTYDPTGDDAPRRTYMVKATATYDYYVTQTTSITNIGSTIQEQTS